MIGFPEFSKILYTRTWILTTFYFLIGIFYILLPAIPVSIPPLAIKALIIPVLIILFKVTARDGNILSHGLIFAALLFSWAGDVALAITRHPETMFMLGLVCFLLTHLLYVVVFFRTPGRNLLLKKFFYSVIPGRFL